MIGKKSAVAAPLVVLLSCAAALTTVIAATPAPPDPISVLKNGLGQAIVLFNDQRMPLGQRREKLRSMSLKYFDFEGMAKSTLGPHWRTLTPAQRDEFVPVFTQFIQDAYLSQMEQATVEKIRRAVNTADVRFIRQTYFSPDYAEVFSTIALQDQKKPLEVNYLMHQHDGRWQVYDITIDAISLVSNYRNQFNRVIDNQGYAKLIADLQAKRQQLQQYMDEEARNGTAP